jgi:hypothetical protein
MKKHVKLSLLKLLLVLFFVLIAPGYIFSDSNTPVNIKIGVYANDQILFKGDLQVTACDESTKNPVKTLNAICAINQLALAQNWTIQKTEYDFGTTIDAVQTFAPDYANNKFWLYFINKEPGASALNKYILNDGDNLEFTYGTNLIKISSPTTITPGQSSTLEATYFDMNAWVRNPLNDVIFVINNIETPSADGKFQITWEPNKTYSISVKKNGFVTSDSISLVSGELPGGNTETNFNLKSAIDFLKSKLNGGNLTSMVTDWVLLSAGTYKDDTEFLTKAKEVAGKDLSGLNSATDVERKAMAEMALGIKPWEGKTDLIKSLLNYFDGQQFGSKDIINDDVFALMVLNKSGFSKNEDEIKNTIKEILSFQKENGSWDSVDMTSASIQALSLFNDQNEVKTALSKAKQNLKDTQRSNGSFGNPFATTWAVQAIKALGENPKDWIKDGKSPIDYLVSIQNADGGENYENGSEEDRVWLTAYTIPAIMNKTWPEIISINASWPDLAKRTTAGDTTAPKVVSTNSSGTFLSSFPVDPQIFLKIEAPQNTSAGVSADLKAELTGLDKKPITNGRIIWSFGDGTTGEGYYLTHSWKFPGEYMIVVEASSGVFNGSFRQKIYISKADVEILGFKEGEDGFVELRNNSKDDIDLSYWILNDKNKQFVFPKNTVVPAYSTTTIPNTVTKISDIGDFFLNYPNGTRHFYFKPNENRNLALNKIQTNGVAIKTSATNLAFNNKSLSASVGNIENKEDKTEKTGMLHFISNLFKKIWSL